MYILSRRAHIPFSLCIAFVCVIFSIFLPESKSIYLETVLSQGLKMLNSVGPAFVLCIEIIPRCLIFPSFYIIMFFITSTIYLIYRNQKYIYSFYVGIHSFSGGFRGIPYFRCYKHSAILNFRKPKVFTTTSVCFI